MKIDPVGAELFYADGQTDRRRYMTKQIVALRDFANASKKMKISNTSLCTLNCARFSAHGRKRSVVLHFIQYPG